MNCSPLAITLAVLLGVSGDLLAQPPTAAPPVLPDSAPATTGQQPGAAAPTAPAESVPALPDGTPEAPATGNADPQDLSAPTSQNADTSSPNAPTASAGTGQGQAAGDDGQGKTWWTGPYLTGDWCGARTCLKERGITFEGNLTQFGFGLNGGINRVPPGLPFSRGDTFAYTGHGDYALTFDLEKFGGLPNGKLLIRAQNWFGQYGNISLNTGSYPPAIFPAALPPVPNDPGVPFITDFIVTQQLSKEWVVYAGKRNVLGGADQDAFAGGTGIDQFMNQAFIVNPAFLQGIPYSTFNAGVATIREWGGAAAFIIDPQDRTNDFFRLHDLFSKGVIVGGEVRLKTNFFSLPGHLHVGGMWKHVEETDLRFNEPPPGVYPTQVVPRFPTLNDSYTIYYGFDQYLQVYSEETKRGWGVFGRASISDNNPNPIWWFVSAGIGGYSPFRHRQGDQFGIAWYYTGLSREFGALPRAIFGPRDGWGVEAFYNIQINPWMNLSPDFQIIKPEAGALANTSYLGGLRLNLKF